MSNKMSEIDNGHAAIFKLLFSNYIFGYLVTDEYFTYHIVGFFEVLNFHKRPIFSFLVILLSRMHLPKAQHCNGLVHFLGVKFHE